MDEDKVVASAPGKVLLTGAYLILEKPNAGLVLSTSSRFFAVTSSIHPAVDDASWAWSWTDVVVSSPQLSKNINYKLSLRNFTLQNVSPAIQDGNAFVEKALELAVPTAQFICQEKERLDIFKKSLLKGLHITILGSNDFYSYRKYIENKGLPLTSSTLFSLPEFSPITFNSSNDTNADIQVPEVAKTGLGSSAAMTSAVVASVLCYLGAVELPCKSSSVEDVSNTQKLEIVHAISQAAHSLAQGKIGSGFDVSAAVFGSQRYVRFSPQVLSCAQDGTKFMPLPEVARDLLKQDWDTERREFSLPPSLQLIVGEPGFGGSHTPSMVGAIQRWRKSDPVKAEALWSELGHCNTEVEKWLSVLKKLAKDNAHEYETTLQACDDCTPEQWIKNCQGDLNSEVVKALSATRDAFLKVRALLRQLGEAAGVPVEPPPQTALLDTTMAMKGVLFAGVPGAGGFDAVFAVTLSKSSRKLVEEMWSRQGVLALCVVEDPQGVRLEDRDPRQMLVNGK
ncbi:hypothetical protein KP509_38G011400 [Ceratopteris richardii]|uniref:phosphomevalonate kinase n=1 Tax=Ceratopteris richardii TaxID=49495 RepID=A0A8T2Q2G7_CERRI|nr:hypothetical protein KP509_38G011400 [Ceratopteris richardii]KAH7277851.1 hypothetical protein KP509_38G011400 [Ceratopteris richardii]